MSNEYFYEDTLRLPELSPADLISLSNDRLVDFARLYTPSMNRQDLLFCRNQFCKEHRVPTKEELTLLDRMAKLRKKTVSSTLLARVGIDDSIIADSYEKQMDHYRMLRGDRRIPLSLEELAQISPQYQERVGRTDRILPSLMETDGTPVLRSFARFDEHKSGPLPDKTAMILLLPEEETSKNYKEKVQALLNEIRGTSLFHTVFSVGTGGLLASLAVRCKGVFMDPARLPDSESKTIDNLTDRFCGRWVIGASRESADLLCEKARDHGLLGIYFAKATESGRLRTSSDSLYFLDLSMEFLRIFVCAKDDGTASISKESFLTVCAHKSMSVMEASGNEAVLLDHTPIRKGNTLIVPVFSTIHANGFSAALNTVLNATLRLIARGGDRRTMGIAVTYSFPKYSANAEDIGMNMAMILGVSRMAEELELSERAPKICYTDEEARTLTCLAYSPLPHHTIPPFAVDVDSNLCFLAFGRTPDGVPSFEGLRRMYDYFTALCHASAVLSAQSVNGDLMEAVRSMTKGKQVAFTELASDYQNRFCQGLLLEISPKNTPENMPVLGKIAGV